MEHDHADDETNRENHDNDRIDLQTRRLIGVET
jgi:hypothetical protein